MLQNRNVYLIKEQVELMKLRGAYDIYDPKSGEKIGTAKEEPGTAIKLLRLVIDKRVLPNLVNVYDYQKKNVVFHIKKPASFLRSKISIFNNEGKYIGYFKSKLLTIGGGFVVFNAMEQVVAEIKGDWKGWNFRFTDTEDREIGKVTKQWAGMGKELFTSADNYIISIADNGNYGEEERILLLAAGLAIDTVFKEK